MNYTFDFDKENSHDKRVAESTRILKKYPNRIPVIVEGSRLSKDKIVLDKNKYLAPSDITLHQFLYIIKRRVELKPEEAIFPFINNEAPMSSQLMGKLYKEHKDEDGFLKILIARESTFGH